MAEPPHDLSAEQAALGCVLLGERDPLEFLTERDFYRPTHQLIFRAMQRLDADGAAIDALTLSDALGSDVERAYLLDLTASVSTSRNWRSYADILRRKANGRHLVDAGTRIAALGYDGGEPSEAAALLGDGVGVTTRRTLGDIYRSLDLTAKSEYLDSDILPGLHMRRGDLVIVGARPSVGKSAFGAQLAADFAQRGVQVRLYTYEMSAEDYTRRFIHARTGMNRYKQDDGLTADEVRFADDAMSGEWVERIDVDDSNPSLPRLRQQIRRFAESGGTVVIVDHMHLLVKQDYEHVTEASRELKLAANDPTLNGPADKRPTLVVMAQLNRGVAREDGTLREPSMSDLRQSGAIEQDADVAVLLHQFDSRDTKPIDQMREAGYLVDEFKDKRDRGSINIAKNRHGMTRRYPAWFSGDDQHWSIMDRTSDEKRPF